MAERNLGWRPANIAQAWNCLPIRTGLVSRGELRAVADLYIDLGSILSLVGV